MNKGERTKSAILDHALDAASASGLGGISIGGLAMDLDLSKSGLFAHFRSKEDLQIQILSRAAEVFAETVAKPVLSAPAGRRRLEALFDRWSGWVTTSRHSGGCVFLAAAIELDDQPGPVRDHLVNLQAQWIQSITRIVGGAVEAGYLDPATDPSQFAQELYGILFSLSFHSRLMKDRKSADRARKSFDALVRRFLSRKD